jgi:hypothetical protein
VNVAVPALPVRLGSSSGGAATATFTLRRGRQAAADRIVYELRGWQAQSLFASHDDAAPSGDFRLTMLLRDGAIAEATLAQTPVERRPLDLADAPCAGDPCRPKRGRDPARDCRPTVKAATPGYLAAFNRILDTVAADPVSVLPWLHADPTHADAPGDPKALLMGALGAWLAQAMVRERAGTSAEVTGPRRELGQAIYRAAWVALFGVSKAADANELGGTLKRLLEAWCDSLLWKGPRCCGEPHGVVIGCALIEGGSIQHIDPFGGRRHVVHYPLLAHWGAQFGIAPLDITASAFFSKLCCYGSLPAVGGARPNAPPTATLVPVGAGYLAVGEPKEIDTAMTEQLKGAVIVSRRPAGLPDMIASAVGLFSGAYKKGTAKPGESKAARAAAQRFVALSLADFAAPQTVVVLVPA